MPKQHIGSSSPPRGSMMTLVEDVVPDDGRSCPRRDVAEFGPAGLVLDLQTVADCVSNEIVLDDGPDEWRVTRRSAEVHPGAHSLDDGAKDRPVPGVAFHIETDALLVVVMIVDMEVIQRDVVNRQAAPLALALGLHGVYRLMAPIQLEPPEHDV